MAKDDKRPDGKSPEEAELLGRFTAQIRSFDSAIAAFRQAIDERGPFTAPTQLEESFARLAGRLERQIEVFDTQISALSQAVDERGPLTIPSDLEESFVRLAGQFARQIEASAVPPASDRQPSGAS